MRVVVQLERIGDIVQSIPALRVIARGDREALLVVREGLADWARELAPPRIRVTEIPSALVDDIRRALASGPRSERVLEAARRACAAASLGPARDVVSLTWDATGAAVAAALAEQGGSVTGPARGPDGRTACHGVWSLYPLAAVDAKPWGRVHMTDVRRLLAEEATGELAATHDMHAEVPPAGGGREIALIVPGASDPARVWPARSFGQVARSLGVAGLVPLVVGGAGDAARAEEIVAASAGAARSLAGRLAPSGLRAVIERAAVVVGGDTGPVHFASWLGAPTVMLMSGRAHAWETGPVRPGDLALQALPVGASPISAIGAELVLAAARSLIEGCEAPESSGTVRVMTARRAASGDALGGIVYDDGEAARTARTLLGRLAAVAGRTAFPERPGGDSIVADALLSDAARLAGRAAERAVAALDASARERQDSASCALSEAVQLVDDVARRIESRESMRVVGALVRLLAAEAADRRAPVRASRLARLFADLEAGLRFDASERESASV